MRLKNTRHPTLAHPGAYRVYMPRLALLAEAAARGGARALVEGLKSLFDEAATRALDRSDPDAQSSNDLGIAGTTVGVEQDADCVTQVVEHERFDGCRRALVGILTEPLQA